jgi:O-antigen ligase
VAAAPLLSTVPDVSLVELVKLFGLGAIGLAGTLIGTDSRRLKTCAWILMWAAAAYTLLALMLNQHNPMSVFGISKANHEGRFTGTLLNPNTAGCLFGMLAALACGFVRSEVSRMALSPSAYRMTRLPQLSMLVVALFFFVGACALTRSRASLACTLIAIVVLAWPRQEVGAHRPTILGVKVSWSWLVLAAVVAAVVVAGAGAVHRMGDFNTSLGDRLQAYGLFRDQALQAPLFGYGLGGFNAVALHVIDAAHAEVMWNFRSAHNALLQAALEGGAPYLFLLLATVLGWFILGVGAPPQPGVRSIRLGLVAGAAIPVGCGLVDIALNVPSIAGLSALFAGLFVGAGYSAVAKGGHARRRPSA